MTTPINLATNPYTYRKTFLHTVASVLFSLDKTRTCTSTQERFLSTNAAASCNVYNNGYREVENQ